MMHIYFLRIRQSLNTNQPMLFRTNSDIYSKIPENQRTYLQLKKVFTSKRYGLNYKMNIKPIDVHTTKPDGFRDIVGIDRPRTAVPTIADIVIPEATDGIYWLSSSEFFQEIGEKPIKVCLNLICSLHIISYNLKIFLAFLWYLKMLHS